MSSGSPTALYVGVIPEDAQPGDEVLITVWESGEVDLAYRPHRHAMWSPPSAMEVRSVS